ncbi:MAG: hypothetical protein ACM3PW_16345 [Chlamydiota bacterium]
MRDTGQLSNLRDRSRSARERSRVLRASSQQLRNSLENLRVHTAGALAVEHGHSSFYPGIGEASAAAPPTPLDCATLTQQRVHNARRQAQALRRRAADLRNQAAEFRARAENLRSGPARF